MERLLRTAPIDRLASPASEPDVSLLRRHVPVSLLRKADSSTVAHTLHCLLSRRLLAHLLRQLVACREFYLLANCYGNFVRHWSWIFFWHHLHYAAELA